MSVKCELIRDLLPLYCDGVASEESRKTVEEHLQGCNTCKEELGLMAADFKTVSAQTEDKKTAMAAAAAFKKMKRKTFLIDLAIALSAVLILAGAFAGFHWFSSAPRDDLDALARKAADYFHADELTVTKTAQRGNYFAALCTDSDGKWYMCEYDRDKIFEDRWLACGGSPGFSAGEIGSWNFGSSQMEAVIIFFGVDLSDKARFYMFKNNGITYTCPIENNTVLDIFIIADGYSDINAGGFTVLDENLQPLRDNR